MSKYYWKSNVAKTQDVDSSQTCVSLFLSYIYIPHSPEYIAHILSEGLILHKRTLGPIKPLIYGLRNMTRTIVPLLLILTKLHTKVVGFMSMKETTYIADVLDHMEHILTSLYMYEAMVESLVDFTFNVCFFTAFVRGCIRIFTIL